MLTVTLADDDALALPADGDATSQPCPPDTVEVDTLKFNVPAPLFNTVMVCGAGAAPPLSVWKRNPLEESWICCWPLPTVTTTGMSMRCPEGAVVIVMVPV